MGEVSIKFFDTTLGKTLKAAIYVAVSAVISYFIAAIAKDPNLFGPVTVIVNAGLVAIKGIMTPGQPNLPK